MKTVTVARLARMGACVGVLDRILERFPVRVPITPENLDWFEANNIDVRWFVQKLPEGHAVRRAYESALKRQPSLPGKRSGCRLTDCGTCTQNAHARRALLAAARRATRG